MTGQRKEKTESREYLSTVQWAQATTDSRTGVYTMHRKYNRSNARDVLEVRDVAFWTARRRTGFAAIMTMTGDIRTWIE